LREDDGKSTRWTNAKLKIEMAFNTLLGDRLRDALAVATLELASKQITEPALQKRHHTAEEEDPHAPARSPDTNTRTLTDRAGLKHVSRFKGEKRT
jgi:hypothetical protein